MQGTSFWQLWLAGIIGAWIGTFLWRWWKRRKAANGEKNHTN
jgi:uncharacterized membrane protein YeaQ/YmgE (transglycosylase-associated protein family)